MIDSLYQMVGGLFSMGIMLAAISFPILTVVGIWLILKTVRSMDERLKTISDYLTGQQK